MSGEWNAGPWRVHEGEHWSIRADETDATYMPICNEILTVEDAYLIAAAPDLYEWLQAVLNQVEKGSGPPNWDGIRAVLAKARGENEKAVEHR